MSGSAPTRRGAMAPPARRPPTAVPTSRPPSRQVERARPPPSSAAGPSSSIGRAATVGGDVSTGEGANMSVVVRCRALSPQERADKSYSIATTPATRGSEITLTTSGAPPSSPAPLSASALGPSLAPAERPASTKTFGFDHVFGESADQSLVFNVRPSRPIRELTDADCHLARA